MTNNMRASIEEYRAVEKAAMKFVKSVAEGNSRYAKELFIDEAVLFGYLDGKLVHIPADTRSAFPVISVQSPVSIQCCWQS